VLNGGRALLSYAKRLDCDPFPLLNRDKPFSPLDELESLRQPNNSSIVVLSVGGNDIREVLGHLDLETLSSKLIKLHKNYMEIVNRITSLSSNDHPFRVIVMTQYKPSVNDDDHYRVYASMGNLLLSLGIPSQKEYNVYLIEVLMKFIYDKIFDLARVYHFPIIDLSNSFDCYNGDLYTYQIEPSEQGGELIAKLITHVLLNHNFNENSVIYRTNVGNQIVSAENADNLNWQVGESNEMKNNMYSFLSSMISLE